MQRTGFVNEELFPQFNDSINSQNQYFQLFMQAHVGIAIFKGLEMEISLANDSILKIWGKTRDVIGKPLLEALPEIASTDYPGILLKVYNTGVTEHARENSAVLIRNGKKELVYFNFVYQPLLEPNGRISGVMVIANEITDQVESRKKLEDSEKRFRNLVEEAEVATGIYIGKSMTIQLANDAMLRVWGKDSSVIGMNLIDALPELEGQPFFHLLDNVYTSGVTYSGTEDRADLMVDGKLRTFYFNFTYKALRNLNNEIYGVLNMAIDVTQEVLAKQQLKENEERLRLSVEIAGLGTWDYVLATQEIIWDERSRELYGVSVEQKIDINFTSGLIYPADLEKVNYEFQKSIQIGSNGVFDMEYRIKRLRDGEVRFVRSKSQTLFTDSGIPYRVTGTLQDITEQKLKAELLEEKINERTKQLKDLNERLQLSNQELEQFAHVASHDMKEPVRKVKIFSGRLNQEFGSHIPNAGRIYLEKIESAANRMSLMIQGVLNYSIFNSTKYECESIDLNGILNEIKNDLELVIAEKNAIIQYAKLPVITGAPVLIYQLFYNLINNSLKFSRKGVNPLIRIEWQHINGTDINFIPEKSADKKFLSLKISDNGIGFRQENAGKIFQTFTRLNSNDEYEGTGLGLALCKKIVTYHNGFITAEAEFGKGAVFTILLPDEG